MGAHQAECAYYYLQDSRTLLVPLLAFQSKRLLQQNELNKYKAMAKWEVSFKCAYQKWISQNVVTVRFGVGAHFLCWPDRWYGFFNRKHIVADIVNQFHPGMNRSIQLGSYKSGFGCKCFLQISFNLALFCCNIWPSIKA